MTATVVLQSSALLSDLGVLKRPVTSVHSVFEDPVEPDAGDHAAQVVVPEPNSMPEWLPSVIDQTNHILSWPSDWHSLGARSVRADVARMTLSILGRVSEASTPRPHLAPGVNGSLQLEWQGPYGEVEVVVEPNLKASVLYENVALGEQYEGDLEPDAGQLSKWVVALFESSP